MKTTMSPCEDGPDGQPLETGGDGIEVGGGEVDRIAKARQVTNEDSSSSLRDLEQHGNEMFGFSNQQMSTTSISGVIHSSQKNKTLSRQTEKSL